MFNRVWWPFYVAAGKGILPPIWEILIGESVGTEKLGHPKHFIPTKEVLVLNPLYVGIDVASKENWACCMNSASDELATFSFPNDLTGATNLKDKCLILAAQHDIDSLLVGMEATATYW